MYGIQPRLRTSAARSVCHRSHPQGIRLRLHAFRYGAYGKEQFYAWHIEEFVGNAFVPLRKYVVLATKFHIGELPKPDGTNLYREVRRHLEDSMSRLRTDYIDLYYLHRINETVRLEDVATVMGRLVKEGLIRGWGLSQVSANQIRTAHEITPLSAVQNIYSMVERKQYDVGIVPVELHSPSLIVTPLLTVPVELLLYSEKEVDTSAPVTPDSLDVRKNLYIPSG